MEYKGYESTVEFDDEAALFHGEILNLRDVVTFEGTSVRELRAAFETSVDEYLEFCNERGEEPEKPFSGRILVRIDPSLHRDMYLSSRAEKKSLNAWIAERLVDAVGSRERDPAEEEAV
jgi:predicted HicB family RNase H-like nuclease